MQELKTKESENWKALFAFFRTKCTKCILSFDGRIEQIKLEGSLTSDRGVIQSRASGYPLFYTHSNTRVVLWLADATILHRFVVIFL